MADKRFPDPKKPQLVMRRLFGGRAARYNAVCTKGCESMTKTGVCLVCIFLCAAVLATLCAAPAAADVSLEHIEEIKADVAALRGLEFREEFDVVVLGEDELAAEAAKIMDREGMGADQITVAGQVLAAFGMLPNGYDIHAAIQSILEEEIAGMYDPDSGALYINSDYKLSTKAAEILGAVQGMDLMDFVLSHEIDHALQDQHFDLGRLDAMRVRSEDMALAFKSVAEGDATVLMVNFSLKPLGVNVLDKPGFDEVMEQFAYQAGMGSASFDQLPYVLQRQLIFPYLKGVGFLARVYEQGGWDAVNQAFATPPASSEQILHYEKYFSGDDPPLDLEGGGEAVSPPAGWELLESNVLGEFHVRIMLKELLGEDDEETRAQEADGWGGDRYFAFGDGSGGFALAWISIWDQEKDAIEFARAYRDALTRRFGAEPERRGQGLVAWTAPCGEVAMIRQGDRVAMTHCIPEADAQAVMQALLAAPAGPAPLE